MPTADVVLFGLLPCILAYAVRRSSLAVPVLTVVDLVLTALSSARQVSLCSACVGAL